MKKYGKIEKTTTMLTKSRPNWEAVILLRPKEKYVSIYEDDIIKVIRWGQNDYYTVDINVPEHLKVLIPRDMMNELELMLKDFLPEKWIFEYSVRDKTLFYVRFVMFSEKISPKDYIEKMLKVSSDRFIEANF